MKVAAAITVVVCVLTLCDAAPVRQSNYHRYLKWLKIAGYYDRPVSGITVEPDFIATVKLQLK